jgi:hypothetical protein
MDYVWNTDEYNDRFFKAANEQVEWEKCEAAEIRRDMQQEAMNFQDFTDMGDDI